MERRDRNFYRPALLWGVAAGVVTFLGEYVTNDAPIVRPLTWAAVGAVTAGLLFARLLTAREGAQRHPGEYGTESSPREDGKSESDAR
jgi:hypothetical protein